MEKSTSMYSAVNSPACGPVDDETECFHCPVCSKFVLSKAAFIHHVTTDHDEQVVAVCKLCEQLFPSGEIQAHALRCKGPHVCSYCRSTFSLPSYLQRHVHRKHSSYPRPICDICGKKFSSTCALSKHEQLHRGELPHSCELCGASFAQKWHFQMHLDSHHAYVELYDEPKPFTCTVCERGFFFAVSLQNHRTQHCKKAPKKLSCHICGKGFAYPSECKRHVETHLKKRSFKCSFCSQRFGRSSLLKAHILRHTNPESLTCQYCLRTYSSRSYLHQHLEKHEAIDAHTSSISSFSTCSALDFDLGMLSDDCGLATVEESFMDKVLESNHEATAFSDCASSPNVNFLHAVLYGASDKI